MSRPLAYRQKPVTVSAMQFLGYNANEIDKWINGDKAEPEGSWGVCDFWEVATPAGEVDAKPGDFIIKNSDGEFQVMTARNFFMSYEGQAVFPRGRGEVWLIDAGEHGRVIAMYGNNPEMPWIGEDPSALGTPTLFSKDCTPLRRLYPEED